MKPNRYNAVGTLLVLIGLWLIAWGSSWPVAFGVLIMLTGNNIDRSAGQFHIDRLRRKIGV